MSGRGVEVGVTNKGIALRVFFCVAKTLLYLDCGNSCKNLYMGKDCIETHTHTCTNTDISALKNWWKLNKVCSSHQCSQPKPEIEMGLCQQTHCQFQLKGNRESGTDEERLLDFLDSVGRDHGAIQL